jgi:poly-gamma-glutamate synthesis protein (capsule biosynthesis protein)
MKILIVSLVALVSTFCLVRYFTAIVSSRQNIVREEKTVLPEKPVVVTAVGDVMLARYVEELSLRNKDWNYPFASSSEIFSGSDIVFGNFEGAIPKVHEQTPNFNFRFSVPKEAAKAAGRAGVNVVTLANNHSLDFGENGYENTVATLKDIGVA